jgi:hypothetical protein
VQWAAGEEPPIRLENASKELALTAYLQEMEKRYVIHLVASVRDEEIRSIAEIKEFYDIKLILYLNRKIRRVIGSKQQCDIKWRSIEGELVIEIPHMKISELILIEYQ